MTRAKAEPQGYRDEGCDSFPACLTCPLAACKYEDSTALLRWKNQERDRQIMDLTVKGLEARAIAKQVGVDVKTVQRVKKRELVGAKRDS